MDGMMQVKLTMLVRLVDFFRAYLFGDGPADEAVAEFKKKVERMQMLVALEQDGVAARAAEVGRYTGVREELLHIPLRHLAGIAAVLAGEQPAIATAVGKSLSGLTGQKFLAAVRSVVTTVQAQHDLLRAHGMAEETLPTLTTLLADYEAALSATNAGRRAHTGARAEMRSLAKDLMVQVRQLDGLVVFYFRDKPDALGAWKSARNIAWPAGEVVKPAAIKPAIVKQESTSR